MRSRVRYVAQDARRSRPLPVVPRCLPPLTGPPTARLPIVGRPCCLKLAVTANSVTGFAKAPIRMRRYAKVETPFSLVSHQKSRKKDSRNSAPKLLSVSLGPFSVACDGCSIWIAFLRL